MLQKLIRPAGAWLLAATPVLLALALASAAPRGDGFPGGRRGDDGGGPSFRGDYDPGYRPSYLYRTADGPYGYYPRGYYPYYNGYPYRYGTYPYRYYSSTFGYFPGYSSGDSGAGLETLPFPSRATPRLRSATTSAHIDAPATITLIAPASADVWFDDSKVPPGTGKLTTPTLGRGRKYTYEVRAAWWKGGRTVTETRDVTVTAGEHLRVTFPSPKAVPAKKGH